MLCQICNKNPATIHVQEIINGEKKIFHLCGECASKKAETEPILQSFNLAEMLYNITSQQNEGGEAAKEEDPVKPGTAVQCAVCGWDTERFRKTGRLGCPSCYITFSQALSEVLGNMHRGCSHLGKVPSHYASDPESEQVIEKVAIRKKISAVQQELDVRIRNEEYEEAALLRDQILELKKQLHENAQEVPDAE